MREIQRSGAPTWLWTFGQNENLADTGLRAGGSVRIPPDLAVKRIMELDVPRQTWLFAFCAWPDEATSAVWRESYRPRAGAKRALVGGWWNQF